MIFEPEPGMSIDLNDESIEFVPVEAEGRPTVFVYAESGKEGTVYKVLKGEEFYALKVFYPEYRNRRLLENTKKLSRFKDLEGFRVAERTIINHKLFPDVITSYPELHYSVLMPWIQGTVWGNLQVMEDHLLERKHYLQIAQALMRVVSKLEARGLAHCDLSNNNFIIDPKFSSIQLIDIEDMYAPDMPRPVPNISYGTPGYRTRWIAQNGLWGSESDRFASAILCSEILTWHDPEIRRNKAGTVSYFDEEEVGENSERYRLMKKCLAAVDPDISLLFEKAWFSTSFDQCPPIVDWMNTLEKVMKPTFNIQEETAQSTSKTSTKRGRKTTQRNESATPIDIPPKMQVSPSIIDFGMVKHPDAELEIEISNIGGSLLTGNIHSVVPWIDVSQNHFSLEPGESRAVTISLNTALPMPTRGAEYRTPNALIIESNDIQEVLGATYKRARPFSYQPQFGWIFLGLISIVLFAIYSPNIYEPSKFLSPFYFGMVGLLAGLATKTVTNFRAFEDALKAAGITAIATIVSQLYPDHGNLTGTLLTLNLILLIPLMLFFAIVVNRDRGALEKQRVEVKELKVRQRDTAQSQVHQEITRSATGASVKRKTRKISTGSVCVFAADGTALYASLPASNNWIVWLEKGAELSPVEPLENVMSSISKYGYYIEVIDKNGNKGFVTATAVKIKYS
jgi:serine/threonine protein kinase